jgi:hypothetical protein
VIDYRELDRYMALRYPDRKRRSALVAKTLLPVRWLSRRAPPAEPVDVLLLHPHAAAGRRHGGIHRGLAGRGLTVEEAIMPTVPELLAARKLAAPANGWKQVPSHWRLQAAHAAWLTARYRPRLVVTFMDDTFLTPFLHEALQASGAKLVNMAHTIYFPNVDFSMCDVDWLFVFGQRSLDNLASAPVRYGSCRAVAVGSPYLADPAPSATAHVRDPNAPPRLLWMGQYLHPARRATLLADLSSLAQFVARHPHYSVSVRLHPLDRGETRRYLEPLAPHVRWLEANASLPEVIDAFDIVLGSFSAGLIDAAARGKPVIAFSGSGLVEALGIADVGLPVVDGPETLAAAVSEVAGNYESASRAALRLAGQHYQHVGDATEHIVGLMHALVEGRDIGASGLPVRELAHKMDHATGRT